MINFIICDDEKHYVDNIIRVIDNVMMNNDVEYNKYTFNEYNKSFLNLVNQKMAFKIYILDIQVKDKKGTEMAKIIRKKDKYITNKS